MALKSLKDFHASWFVDTETGDIVLVWPRGDYEQFSEESMFRYDRDTGAGQPAKRAGFFADKGVIKQLHLSDRRVYVQDEDPTTDDDVDDPEVGDIWIDTS